MSRATLAAAKLELVGLLRSGTTPSIAGVDLVYDYLPAKEKVTEKCVLGVFTDGVTAENWLIGIALFLNTTDDEKLAQDTLDILLPAIDAKTNNGGFGPAAWQIVYPGERTAHYIATCVYQVGREDAG